MTEAERLDEPAADTLSGRLRDLAVRVLTIGAVAFAVSLTTAIAITLFQDRIDDFSRRAEHAASLVAMHESRSRRADEAARQAEALGNVREAERMRTEAYGRARMADYHRTLQSLYLAASQRPWRGRPDEPMPPAVELIPDRGPGMPRGPGLGIARTDAVPPAPGLAVPPPRIATDSAR